MIRALCLPVAAFLSASVATSLSANQLPVPSMMFAALETSDLERSEAFYTHAIGLKKIARISQPGAPVTKDAFNFSGDPRAGEPLLILEHHNATTPVSRALIGMRIADVHAAAAQVRAAGYKVLSEPAADDHGSRLTTLVRDPDGNLVELVQLHF